VTDTVIAPQQLDVPGGSRVDGLAGNDDGIRDMLRRPVTELVTATPHARRLRVLVVDDEGMCRAALRRELIRLGFEVTLAGSGAEALASFDAHGADLVLTDLLMPNMTGLQLIHLMRAERPDRPMIACTGGTLPEVAACRRLAADGIPLLVKPFDGDELRVALQRALGGGDDVKGFRPAP